MRFKILILMILFYQETRGGDGLKKTDDIRLLKSESAPFSGVLIGDDDYRSLIAHERFNIELQKNCADYQHKIIKNEFTNNSFQSDLFKVMFGIIIGGAVVSFSK